nr:MAG TPA: hypothetical protein [Microviridae sp.]
MAIHRYHRISTMNAKLNKTRINYDSRIKTHKKKKKKLNISRRDYYCVSSPYNIKLKRAAGEKFCFLPSYLKLKSLQTCNNTIKTGNKITEQSRKVASSSIKTITCFAK